MVTEFRHPVRDHNGTRQRAATLKRLRTDGLQIFREIRISELRAVGKCLFTDLGDVVSEHDTSQLFSVVKGFRADLGDR